MGRNFDLCAEDRRATHAHNAHPTHTHTPSLAHTYTRTYICIYQIHVSNSRFINLSYEAMHKTDITTARVHGYIIKRPGIPLSPYTSSIPLSTLPTPSLPAAHTHKCNYTFQLTHELWNENCKKKNHLRARSEERASRGGKGEAGLRGAATPSITSAETLKLCEYICINF